MSAKENTNLETSTEEVQNNNKIFYVVTQEALTNIVNCVKDVVPSVYVQQTIFNAINDNVKVLSTKSEPS